MMSAQMKNCRHVGFRCWGETNLWNLSLANKKENKRAFSTTLSNVHSVSCRCIVTAAGWLECWLWKRLLRETSQPSMHTLKLCLPGLTETPLSSELSFAICSSVHNLCKGTCESDSKTEASALWEPLEAENQILADRLSENLTRKWNREMELHESVNEVVFLL